MVVTLLHPPALLDENAFVLLESDARALILRLPAFDGPSLEFPQRRRVVVDRHSVCVVTFRSFNNKQILKFVFTIKKQGSLLPSLLPLVECWTGGLAGGDGRGTSSTTFNRGKLAGGIFPLSIRYESLQGVRWLLTFSFWKKRKMEAPSMWEGIGNPAISKKVGAKSTLPIKL